MLSTDTINSKDTVPELKQIVLSLEWITGQLENQFSIFQTKIRTIYNPPTSKNTIQTSGVVESKRNEGDIVGDLNYHIRVITVVPF